jgi:hypothetical protein
MLANIDPTVGSHPATGMVRLPDGSMVGTTFTHGTGVQAVYRLTLLQPFSVAIQPDPVTAARTGRGTLSVDLKNPSEWQFSPHWSFSVGLFFGHRRIPPRADGGRTWDPGQLNR